MAQAILRYRSRKPSSATLYWCTVGLHLARLLGWLPVGGLGVAVLMGAGPGSAGAGQGVTTASIGAGALLMLAGRTWTRQLVREAAGARG